jgi:hypothetical protein
VRASSSIVIDLLLLGRNALMRISMVDRCYNGCMNIVIIYEEFDLLELGGGTIPNTTMPPPIFPLTNTSLIHS